MNFKFKVIETEQQIIQGILSSIKDDFDSYMKNAAKKASSSIQNIVRNAIISSPEYQSIISGKLQLDFGIPDPVPRLQNLLNIWENIQLESSRITISRARLNGGFTLYMVKSDFSDVLSADAAKVITEKNQTLNWLEWLLLMGDKTIIRDYHVVYGPNPASRTGGAIMVKKQRWKVPSEFSGTITDNWITRALDSVESSIDNAITKALDQ